MNQPVLYQESKRILTEYHRVDEVKDFRDKAKAMELYAREAQDHSLQRLAAQARLRAERRWGELYKDEDKAKGGNLKGANQYTKGKEVVVEQNDCKQSLSEMGVSKDQSSKWQKLADVPEEEFEGYFNDEISVPSCEKVLSKTNPPKDKPNQADQDSIFIWGTLNDLKEVLQKRSLSSVLSSMPDPLIEETEQNLVLLRRWINA